MSDIPADFKIVPQGINENPICPDCKIELKHNKSSTSLGKCPECRDEYKVRRKVTTGVKKIEKDREGENR